MQHLTRQYINLSLHQLPLKAISFVCREFVLYKLQATPSHHGKMHLLELGSNDPFLELLLLDVLLQR